MTDAEAEISRLRELLRRTLPVLRYAHYNNLINQIELALQGTSNEEITVDTDPSATDSVGAKRHGDVG